MKKALFGLFILVLIGGGCVFNRPVEGDWFLAFDMPEGWVMVKSYMLGSEAIPINDAITRDISEIVIQSTSKGVYYSTGSMPDELTLQRIGEIETENFSYIRVLKLDDRRIIPSDAEDLGDGFSKLKICDDGGECTAGGRYNYDYYLQTENGKFQFLITLKGHDIDEAEDLILSAQEVTILNK
jgi:hypothetical protein